ncbi:hypothetical protein B1L07_01685 [Stenotrophomonas acidaminiphila]|nr:hypothetical protein B1L07_01685 [Stenotrophomonas acidaminiphila]
MAPKGPIFVLRDVQDLIKAGKVIFTPQAERDYQELGFDSVSAAEVVRWIDPSEYRDTLEYDDGKSWDDYVTTARCPATQTMRRLYIKFRIPSPAAVQYLVVTSFHCEKVLK